MLNDFEGSCLQINKRIIFGTEAFLISDFLEDIKCLRQENGIEESIITIYKNFEKENDRHFSRRNFTLSKWEILDCRIR